MPDDVERAAERNGGDRVGGQHRGGGDEEGGGVEPSHPVQPSPGAPLEQAQADIGGHARQCGQRDMGDQARAEPEQQQAGTRRGGGWRAAWSRRSGRSPGSARGCRRSAAPRRRRRRGWRCRRRLARRRRRRRGGGGGGPGSARRPCEVIRMLTEATNASPSAAGKTSRTSDGSQVKPANGGNDIETTPSGFSRQPSSEADGDGQRDAEQRQRAIAAIAAPRRRPRPPRSCPAAAAPIGPGRDSAIAATSCPIGLDEIRCREAGRPSSVAELEDHHHRADAAREARDDRVRHLGDVPAQPEHAEDHQEDGRRPGRPSPRRRSPGYRTAPVMNGTVALAVPPIRTGLRPSSAVIGRRQDRGEQAQLGRQAHQPRQRQAVGQRDQGGDGAAGRVARQPAPAVAAARWRRRAVRSRTPCGPDSDIHDVARTPSGTSPSPPAFRS